MENKNFYDILELGRSASQDEIKNAYRRLARRYHPDVSKEPNAEERFKEVNEAYETLRDPERRSYYDQFGTAGATQTNDSQSGFGFGRSGFETRSAPGFDFWDDILGGMGKNAGGGAEYRPGDTKRSQPRNETADIDITVEDSIHGRTKRIMIPNVSGQTPRSINVKIPKGITDGSRIRLAKQASNGLGDLLLRIHFMAHHLFKPMERDLYITVPIAPWEAALGASIQIPTADGTKVEMKIPSGTPSEKQFRLRGRGLPASPPGDQIVVVRIAAPPPRNDEERELYQRMAETMNFDLRQY